MIQKTTLENGIRVVTEKISGAHSVTVGIWVECGSRHEKLHEHGISHFVEHMLFKGTERRSALDIAREIDSVGGVLNAFTGREYCCYYAKVLARKLPLAVDILSDIALNSVFDLDEIEKERKVILQEICMVEDTPDDLVHDLFSHNFWKNHPLGFPILGTQDSVNRIFREGLVRFMAERYCGNDILVCAAGNLDHEAILNQISEAFNNLGECRCPIEPSLPRHERGVHVVEKDLEQVHLCLGSLAVPQTHPDRYATYLLNNILGGSMSSRLFQKIREELGLAYSTYSYLNCHSDAGALVLYAGTSPDAAREVLSVMLKELRELKTEPVSEDELHATKEQLKGHLLLSMESSDNRMTRLAKNEIYLGRQLSLREVIRNFDLVTRDDLLRVADFTLKDECLHLQVVGKIRETDFTPLDLTLG